MCWIEVEDHFVRSFATLTHMNMHDQNICIVVSDMSGLNINISTKNESYEHRDSIVSRKRYCNFHLTLSDNILIFWAPFLVHTHFHYLGSQSYIFLLRIVGYKLGFVRGPTYHKYCPQRCGSGKPSIRSIRYKKYRHRKKCRIKKKEPRDNHSWSYYHQRSLLF